MNIIFTSIGFVVTLTFLGGVMGFSPVLYAMVARFSATNERRNMLVYATIAGILAAVLSMFTLGSGLALIVHDLWHVLGHGELERLVTMMVVATVMIIYALRERNSGTAKPSPGAVPMSSRSRGMRSIGVFLFAFGKTLVKVSGVAAALAIYSMRTAYELPWFVIWLIALPIVCAAAVAPFVLIAASERIAPKTYTIALTYAKRMQLYKHRHKRSVAYSVGLLGGMLLLYAIVTTVHASF